MVVYFIFRGKISFIRYKFLSDIFVIAFFIFSIDICIAPHRYNNMTKDYLEMKEDKLKTNNYPQDFKFLMDNYENNKSDNSIKYNIKDGTLEEFKHIKDIKKY